MRGIPVERLLDERALRVTGLTARLRARGERDVDDRLTPLDDPEDEVREPLDRVGLGRETLGRRDTLLERDELEREPLGRGGLDRALLEREGRFPANSCDAI